MPGVPDCTQILNLSEGTVVDNLKARYDADEIHTYVGSMLVVLNPYKLLPIYDDKHMGTFAGVRLTQASPHVFALAEEVRACSPARSRARPWRDARGARGPAGRSQEYGKGAGPRRRHTWRSSAT